MWVQVEVSSASANYSRGSPSGNQKSIHPSEVAEISRLSGKVEAESRIDYSGDTVCS
jgi:hypothetical protein